MNAFVSALAIAALVLTACTTPPDQVQPRAVDARKYDDLDCDALRTQAARYDEESTELRGWLERAHESQSGFSGAMLWLFFGPEMAFSAPAVFKEKSGQYARARGEYEAILAVARRQACPGIDIDWPGQAKAQGPAASAPR